MVNEKNEEVELVFGIWREKSTCFERDFNGHRFTDDEVKRLLKGERIEVRDLISRSGKRYKVCGRLEKKEAEDFVGDGFMWAEFVPDPCNDEALVHPVFPEKRVLRWKGKAFLLILIVGLIVLTVMVLFCRRATDSLPDDGIRLIDDEETTVKDPALSRIRVNSKMALKDGGRLSIGFKNSAANPFSQKLLLYQGGRLIYESPELEAGYELPEVRVDRAAVGNAEVKIASIDGGKEAGNSLKFEVEITRSLFR